MSSTLAATARWLTESPLVQYLNFLQLPIILVLSYIRFINLFGLNSQVTVAVPLSTGEWDALVGEDTEAATVSRSGLGDSMVGMIVFLAGAHRTTFGNTTLNGVEQDDPADNSRAGLVLGLPVGRGFTAKLSKEGDMT